MKRQAPTTENNRKEQARKNFIRAYEQRRAVQALRELENNPNFANAPLSPVRAGILADARRDAGVANDVIRRTRAPSIMEERARAQARLRQGP